MMSQYGVRMYSAEFREMTCNEFFSLLSGLNPDTPLGNLVQIRSENDPEVLKRFNSAQKKIRDEWRRKHPLPVNRDKEAHEAFLAQIQGYFMSQ
jgi:hypothetical protein